MIFDCIDQILFSAMQAQKMDILPGNAQFSAEIDHRRNAADRVNFHLFQSFRAFNRIVQFFCSAVKTDISG